MTAADKDLLEYWRRLSVRDDWHLDFCASDIRLMVGEIERLTLENWQLKGALGYEVPGDIPEGNFKCGLCDARRRGPIYGDPQEPPDVP